MAARLLALSLRTVNNSGKRMIPLGAAGAHSSSSSPIGNREIVGYGFNGVSNYADRVDFPMPAIRFKESTPDIQVSQTNEYLFYDETIVFCFCRLSVIFKAI